jgi:hypothetical protein
VRSRLLIAITVASLVLPPAWAAAAPSNYSRVLAAYQAHGSVPSCQFTSAQLEQALKGVDTYGEQYFADFTNAIQSALAARASGSCLPGRTGFPRGAAASRFTPPALTAATGAELPAPILVLAGLTVMCACAGALALLWRRRGWDPRWAAWLRHAAGDSAYRAASRVDRVRRG